MPGLVVDARADKIHLAGVLCTERARDLTPAVLYAVAKADSIDLAMFDGGPRVHRHWVGVVEHLGAGFADLPDVPAEIEERRNRALPVHDAAGADRVADTLIDAILQRYLDVGREGLEATDANAVDDIARSFESLAALGGRRHPRRKLVHFDDALDDLPHHVEIMLIDIRERDLDVLQFRHAQDVDAEFLSEFDAPGANDGYLQFR